MAKPRHSHGGLRHGKARGGAQNASAAEARQREVSTLATASKASARRTDEAIKGAAGLAASMATGVSQLHQELAEVKQHRINVKQLQEALAADVALLRESTVLEKLSTSRRGRQVAELQLKKSEQLVK
ncbi:unnamed protein product, partial [Prorocentrum cordatum]